VSTIERIIWGAAGGMAAIAAAVDWWRFERLIRREQQAHETGLREIRQLSANEN
jgi:hypothetical protein